MQSHSVDVSTTPSYPLFDETPFDASHAAPVVAVKGLAKAFGATQALRNASFELRAGEVHALVGENGSGKSTLVKILTGVHEPGSGSVEVAGKPVEAFRTPREAYANGIVAVMQEILVVEARSVLENVWLGVDSPLRSRFALSEKRTKASEVLQMLLGRPPSLGMSVEELSLSERQACCIARAIVRQPKVLILDEATSALDIATRDNLFEIVRVLCRKGVGVIFITHRMDEISEIGDRITVLRSGTTVGTLERGSWTTRELVHLMTGADQLIDDARPASDAQTSRRGKPVLSVKNLQLHLESKPFDAEIHTGELVGVAGLEGHGQEAFLDALRGSVMVKGQTLRHEDGRDIAVRAPSEAARLGIVYVPRERRQSLFGWMSIRENFGMPTLPRDTVPRNSRVTWLRPRETRRRFAAYVDRLGIVLGRQDDRITTLSGGNQQKVVIARWLAASPRLLILNDPTRGIDIGAKRDLYRLLTQLVSEGMAVVMLSTELDEHIELMDRVLVFRDHELYREIDRSELSRHVLLSAFFGQVDAQEHTS